MYALQFQLTNYQIDMDSTYYDAFTALRPNLFGTRDEDIHSARRKACSNSFSLQSVAMMEPFIDGCLDQLITRLDKAALTGEQVDLKQWIAFFVMDVLGELAFSASFGVLNDGDESLMPPVREHVGHQINIFMYFKRLIQIIAGPSCDKFG
jgi:cytochrome P450